ncbi:MAG TPA: class F sortase [Candidatus Microsaccharimonas sp.]|jgi:LPXTG-site transpeptidase (sortase) family protein
MHRRHKSHIQKVFIGVAVSLISLCATFIILYLVGAQHPRQQPVLVVVPHVTHDASAVAVIAPPVQLTIDGIHVSAPVNAVGLAKNGDMDIDSNATQVAWYKLGPKPGEEGSAVIAGHYGWLDGVPSVFNDLNKLSKGDRISTTGDDGAIKTFAVTRTAIYSPDRDATDVFRSDDGKAHLNLITCQGTWVNSAHTYTERLVVFTDLVK